MRTTGPKVYWTKERCAEEAIKYKKRLEFSQKSSKAYSAARRNGWLDDICGHMRFGIEIKWTKESIQAEALKYATRKDFVMNASGAAGMARRNGWFDEICSHMVRYSKPMGHWTKERCAEAALKYSIRKDFQNGSPGAYCAAFKNSWMDEICSHMRHGKKIKWTKKKCREMALTCNTMTEFQKNYQGGYGAARKNGWLDEISKHMDKSHTPKGFWTKEKVFKAVKDCKSLTDFTKRYSGARKAADRFGWMDEVKKKLPEFEKPKGYWNNKENIQKVVSQCDSIAEFRTKFGGAHSAAIRNGWAEELMSHLYVKHPPRYWTKERCAEKAKLCGTRSEMMRNYPSAHGAAVRNKWMDDICRHMTKVGNNRKRCVYVYKCLISKQVYVGLTHNIQERDCSHRRNSLRLIESFGGSMPAVEQVSDYIDSLSAGELEKKTIIEYRENGWRVLNKASGGALGSSRTKWTKDLVRERALKYSHAAEFQKEDKGAYIWAIRNNCLSDVTSHFVPKQKPSGYWTKERCIEKAKQCKTRTEFRKRFPSACSRASQQGFLQEIISHLPVKHTNNKWTYDVCLNLAKKCMTRTEFSNLKLVAYNVARRNGWLDEFFPKKKHT